MIKITIAATIDITVSIRKFAPWNSPKLHFSSRRGADFEREPVKIRTDSDKKNDVPIAEIKLAKRFVPRARRRR